MKNAMKLYTTIKKRQLIVGIFVGLLALTLQVGSSLWKHTILDTVASGTLVTGIWLLLAYVSLFNDQSRHLEQWLYTQKISRGQLFLTRFVLLVLLPLVVGFVINMIFIAVVRPDNIGNVLLYTLIIYSAFYGLAGLFALIYTVVGPIWLKVTGIIYTIIAMSVPATVISSILVSSLWIGCLLNLVVGSILILLSYLLSRQLSADVVDEAVRFRKLRWPVVIFVFVALYGSMLLSSSGTIELSALLDNMVLPGILALITFVLVFKPTFKISWNR